MKRGKIERLIQDYLAAGGAIARMPEAAVSIDWSQSRFRAMARIASRFGHEKRRAKSHAKVAGSSPAMEAA